jgi:hypothetical protein
VCCPEQRACGDICCPDVCQNGACPDEECDHPVGVLNIRGESCCPTGVGSNMVCGQYRCSFILSGAGPGGCDVWCAEDESGLSSHRDIGGCEYNGVQYCCWQHGGGPCVSGCI